MNDNGKAPVPDYAVAPKRPSRSPVPLVKRSVVSACLGLLAVWLDIAMRADADVPRKLLWVEISLGSLSLILMGWALLRGAWTHYKFWILLVLPTALFPIYFATLHPRLIHN
jgi:hypothetical protein